MKQTDVSIITVNYNGLKDTEELIRSLQKHLLFSYELIVVDNGSRVNEATILQAMFPSIKAIRSEANLGFAGGNNLGIKESVGEFLLFLNNDIIVKDNSIQQLIESLQNAPTNIGGASPKILFAFTPDLIQFAGYTPLSKITLRNNLIGYLQKDDGRFDQQRKTPYLHGAAMCIRKEVIEKAGLMPELYFLYYEELDWCERITSSGYELSYIPQARVYHKESSSTGVDSPLKAYYMTRNRLLFAWRNRAGLSLFLAILYLIIFAFSKSFITFLVTKKHKQAKAVIKGIGDFFKMNKKE